MSRSSQEKVKASSMNQDATKLRNMQKAYGVLPKTKTTKSLTTAGSTSIQGAASGTSQKSKRPILASGVVSKSEKSPSPSKSVPSDTTKKTSKIIAASKANYVEKYGTSRLSSVTGKVTPNQKPTRSVGGPMKVDESADLRKMNQSNATSSPNKHTKPTNKSIHKPPSVNSMSSTTSGLASQKPPKAFYESDKISEPVLEDDYEEDFEEVYESDFEEMASSAESEEDPNENDSEMVMDDDKKPAELHDDVEDVEEEYDKSSSIQEFEKLEKMVEQETFKGSKPFDQQHSKVINVKAGGSGEPDDNLYYEQAGAPDQNSNSDEEEDEESEEEGSSDHEPSPAAKKQIAFPTTAGFSISSSLHQQNIGRPPLQEQIRTQSGRLNKNKGPDSIPESRYNVSVKVPETESKSQKMTRTQRGRIIQSMIKLDRVSVELFHLVPYQYERFMAIFSATDRLQASTQTDQEKSEESVQTESIDQIAKWTQKPPTWSTTSSSCDIRIVRQEAIGVGSDEVCEDLSPDQKILKQFDFLKNWEQLSNFILRASRKVLYVLEAEDRIQLASSAGSKGALETIKMCRGLSVLSKLAMHTLAGDGEFVACANGRPPEGAAMLQPEQESKTTNGNKKHTSKNLITVWSLKEPSMPLYFLRVWGYVSALKIHMIGRMVISGNKDGSLSVWNLDEPLCYHSHYQEQAIRTPSVNTSCMMPTHDMPIMGVEMSSDSKNTFSVVSIDKEGTLITWSCLRAQDALGESSLSQHSSAWSTIHMSVRHQIKLADIVKDHLQITCFQAWDNEMTSFLFGTFNGYIAKVQILEATTAESVEKYHERSDSNPRITCMDMSKTLNILALGCEDGRCRLFEMSRKKMVLSLGGKEEPVKMRWSGRRASVLYVALRDSLLIWDLLTSEMNPWKTIHLKDIQDFVLYSPSHKEYLVIVSGKDLIISTPADEVKPLSSRDFARMQSYFSLLC